MNPFDRLGNAQVRRYPQESKTAPESVALTADWNPGPNRPHLDERGSAVGIMPRGWTANDLTPHDIAPLLNNFITKFEPGTPDECWLWRGYHHPQNGYGILGRSYGSPLLAHRVAWVAFTGQPLTDQLTIDHLCMTKSCVNPDHLEPVTLAENTRRYREHAGHVPGGKRPRERKTDRPYTKSGAPRKPARPFEPGETPEERNRKNALAYYYANRDRILAARRGPRPSPPVACEHCDKEIRRDGIRRHVRRLHGGDA